MKTTRQYAEEELMRQIKIGNIDALNKLLLLYVPDIKKEIRAINYSINQEGIDQICRLVCDSLFTKFASRKYIFPNNVSAYILSHALSIVLDCSKPKSNYLMSLNETHYDIAAEEDVPYFTS